MSRPMVILHNPHDAESRSFVETYQATPDVTVVDWYDYAARTGWIEAGGTDAVSGFPSVAYERPEYDLVGVRAIDVPDEEVRTTLAAGLEVVRLPDDLAAVERAAVGHDALAAVTWAEAVAVLDPDALAAELAAAEEFVIAAEEAAPDLGDVHEARERLAKVAAPEHDLDADRLTNRRLDPPN